MKRDRLLELAGVLTEEMDERFAVTIKVKARLSAEERNELRQNIQDALKEINSSTGLIDSKKLGLGVQVVTQDV
jgi:hypothetical protein